MAPSAVLPDDSSYASASLKESEKHTTAQAPLSSGRPLPLRSADIDYIPDLAKFQARVKALLASRRQGAGAAKLADGWPSLLSSPLVWTGEDFPDPESYIYELSSGLGLHFFRADRTTFPLPNLMQTLTKLGAEVHTGKGFVVLRGLHPAEFTPQQNSIIYLGVSSYVAEQRGRQSSLGRMLMHVTNVTSSSLSPQQQRSLHSNVNQPFHTDLFCEVLALYCLSTPASGGRTYISSTWKIYNELATTRPDIITLLAQDDWMHTSLGYDPPYYERPLLFLNDKQQPILNFSRRMITGSTATPRHDGAPPITEEQAEALDYVHFLAERHCLEINWEIGDMRFINNLSVLHRRDSFQDSPTAKRHLLRLFLRNEELGWHLPPSLQLMREETFGLEIDADVFGDIELRNDLEPEDTTRCG